MKILHIIRSVNPEGGGPIEGVLQLARVNTKRGNTNEILSLDSPNVPYISECPLKVYPMGPAWGKYGYTSKIKPWLAIHAADYDVFVINGIWQYHSFAAHSVLKRLNMPYVLFTHGMLDPWFKHRYPLKHFKKWLYWFWGEYPVLRDASKVLFTSVEEMILARQSFSMYQCNEQVVNYGTAGHSGNAQEQSRLFLEHFPELQGKRFLLFLSRIHPKKGVDLLIEAFSRASKSQSDLHLVIAGPDQVGWKEELVNLARLHGISDKITWTGMLKGDLKWGGYHNADAFILPSHQENFGIVVAEALSCAVPVLISNKVNIWREIVDDNAGLMAEDTVDGCEKLIKGWLQLTNNEQAEMRRNALRSFTNRFEITQAASGLLAVLESVVGRECQNHD